MQENVLSNWFSSSCSWSQSRAPGKFDRVPSPRHTTQQNLESISILNSLATISGSVPLIMTIIHILSFLLIAVYSCSVVDGCSCTSLDSTDVSTCPTAVIENNVSSLMCNKVSQCSNANITGCDHVLCSDSGCVGSIIETAKEEMVTCRSRSEN